MSLTDRMYLAFAALFAAVPVSCAIPPDVIARQLTLTYEQFELADDPAGWRQLNGKGCIDAALGLLTRYDAANSTRLSVEQRSELAFHRGQALAFAARNVEAIPHFEQALRYGGSEEWTTYVAATLSFLRRDWAELRTARNRYAAIAPGSMRQKILDGLEVCPTKPYMVAVHCAM